MLTTVYNLITGAEYEYILPPDVAVRNAFAQFEMRDYNTWDYESKYPTPDIIKTDNGIVYTLGDYTALLFY